MKARSLCIHVLAFTSAWKENHGHGLYLRAFSPESPEIIGWLLCLSSRFQAWSDFGMERYVCEVWRASVTRTASPHTMVIVVGLWQSLWFSNSRQHHSPQGPGPSLKWVPEWKHSHPSALQPGPIISHMPEGKRKRAGGCIKNPDQSPEKPPKYLFRGT